MGLLYKDLLELNKLYTDKVGGVQEVSEDENKGYVVTAADKKGNTPAWQGYKAGKKKKDGKPMYRAADHLKNEEVEVDESIGSAIDKGLSAGADVAKVAGKAAVGGVKVASKVVKKTAGAAGRVAGTAVGAVKSAKKGYKGGASTDEEVKIDAMDHYLGELKKVTYASYAKKATTDLANRSFDHGESEKRQYEPDKEDEKETKKQATRKKGIDRAIDKLAKEEYLGELKKSTLGSYVAKGSKDLSDRRFDQGRSEKATYEPDADDDKEEMKLRQREKGIKRAAKKLSKEELDVFERLVESGKFTMEEVAKISGIGIEEAQTAYEKARKAAARRAADRNAARKRGEMGGRMERETYTNEAGKEMHYKGYSA
jgi:hypothetical protein